MWVNSLTNAMSQVSDDVIDRASNLNAEDFENWTEDNWDDYNKVAEAIAEPFNFDGGESDEEDFFYEMIEKEGFYFVKSKVDFIGMSKEWTKIVEIMEIVGY